jgi:hypothetical protein
MPVRAQRPTPEHVLLALQHDPGQGVAPDGKNAAGLGIGDLLVAFA